MVGLDQIYLSTLGGFANTVVRFPTRRERTYRRLRDGTAFAGARSSSVAAYVEVQEPRVVRTLGVPTIGGFKGGRGEFFDTEPFNAKNILVRNVWPDIILNSCRFEQSFSPHGSEAWELNWVATDTRIKDESDGMALRTPDDEYALRHPYGYVLVF
jgi:hypothetical protein